MMSSKNYQAIARELASCSPLKALDSYGQRSADTCGDRVLQFYYCVGAVADAMARDNPRFDRNRFYQACGIEPHEMAT